MFFRVAIIETVNTSILFLLPFRLRTNLEAVIADGSLYRNAGHLPAMLETSANVGSLALAVVLFG
jgi:hypothetical protein